MPDPRRFKEAGFAVETTREGEGPVRLVLLPDPAAALARGEPIKRSLYRAAARVDVAGLGSVVLKVHHPHGAADVVRSALRPSRARREWRAARYLYGAGIPTPEPLAMLERRRGPLLEQAASASRHLATRKTFEPALLSMPGAKARVLLERATALVRALHDRGVSHRDLHSGNVLVGPGPGDRATIHVIDLHKVRVGHPVGRRRRAAELGQWLHSLAASVGPGGRLRALVAYAGGRADREGLERLWRDVGRATRARERRRLRSRSRRCVEEGLWFTRDVGAGRGFRARTLPGPDLERVLAAHDRALASGEAGGAIAKRGRKSAVTRQGAALVKERLEGGAARRLEGALVPGRRIGGYRNAQRLLVRGVGTAAPLAFVRRGGRTFTLYEDLSAFPRLDHRVRAALRARAWSRARARLLLETTADLAARLHRLGIWHGDLKACNWLVGEHASGFDLRIVDTDRVRFLRRVSRARRLRNVAQLAASIPVVVTKTDRLRWWRRYVQGTELAGRAAERAAARDVAALLARKTVVVDEPIE